MTNKKDLNDLLDKFQEHFAEKRCYNFLFQRLIEMEMLDIEQCRCYSILTIKGEVIPLSIWGKEFGWKNKGFQTRGYVASVNSFLELPQKPEECFNEIFARCKICKKKYILTKNTYFENKNLPLKSLLLILLIGEFFEFNAKNKKEIKESIENLCLKNLIHSTRTDIMSNEYGLNPKTINNYTNDLINSNYTKELQQYKIIEYLQELK